MSESTTRKQEYRYQTKTVSMANGLFDWGMVAYQQYGLDTIMLRVSVPKDMVELKGLFIEVIVDAQSSIPGAQIKSIGATDNLTTVNIPFVNNEASIKIDLSHMVDKFVVNDGYIGVINQPFININLVLACDSSVTAGYGKVKLWKVDMTYTTEGIR